MTSIESTRRTRWESVLVHRGGTPRDRHTNHLLLIDTPTLDPQRPPLHPDNTQARIEWAWKKYEGQLSRLEWLDDDRIPYLDCVTGTEIFAAAFGCEVDYPSNDNPFARPLVSSPNDAHALAVPSLDSPCLSQMFRIGDELAKRAGPEALHGLPDIQSPMDIAGIIWDKNSFFVSIVEEPEAVLEFATKTGQLLTQFLDEWFGRYGPAFIAHYPDYYMPGGITLSEDEIGSVSPAIFEKLFLPELNALSNRYGGIGIHCCAHAVHQWDGLARVQGLRLLNLNQPDDVLARSFGRFADVAVQMPIAAPLAPPESDSENSAGYASWQGAWRDAFEAVGDATVVFSASANTEAEARMIANAFRNSHPT